MAPLFELKDYQADVLAALRAYLGDVAAQGDHAALFQKRTGAPYVAPPQIDDIPFVCLRVPTGGGKTILAAHAIPIAAQTVMRSDSPVVIWFTPSTIIRDQTLKTLRDRAHPNRRALADAFGENVRVMDLDEALHARRPDYDGGAVVIVSTVQAFRADNTEGRKVYDANGDLMDHFSGLSGALPEKLETGADGAAIPSLANVFFLRRPLVIADEAHNMSTQLSFDTLARLNPSLILEFTATPTKHEERDDAKGKYPSNVLHHVSAAELKAADMIKMPIVLRGRPDPKETIADAMGQLGQLEALARTEEGATREFIRPIMLLQAEAESATRETIHAEVLRKMLVEDFRVPEADIAISTGKKDELDGVDLFARDCRIRFIVTQQKLREGWDCSFAYVLCSVAPQKSERSVEQLLGRILRMPHARRKTQEELNTAFAFATTTSFQDTARLLKEGLVANGFEKAETEFLVRTPQLFGFAEGAVAYVHEVAIPEALDPEPFKAQIERATGGRVTIDLAAWKIVTRGALSRADRLHMTMAWPEAAPAIDALHRKSWGWLNAAPQVREPIAFTVPGLAVRAQNGLELFDKAHYLDHPWPLEECDPSPVAAAFSEAPAALGARFDIGEDGEVRVRFEDVARTGLFGRDAEWSKAGLVNWLDRRLGERRDVTPASSRLFIGAALDLLMAKKGITIHDLGRARFRLQPLLANVIRSLRRERETEAWDRALGDGSGLDFVAHADAGFHFDSASDRDYSYSEPYRGGVEFRKHLFPVVGDLKSSGEEFDCALYLDNHPRVRAWLRNTERKQNSFWLQTSSDRFYPDFVAQIEDGRILAVEYKGEAYASNDDSREKKRLGAFWAAQSAGRCVFVMVENGDHGAMDRALGA